MVPLREGPERDHHTIRLLNTTMNALTETHAPCRDTDPDALFTVGKAQNQAVQICHGCPIRVACLTEAMEHRIEDGVWGGMTVRQRHALRRKHGDAWHTAITTLDHS